MTVSFRDTLKLLSVSVITCCAVLVCAMFLNYYLDLVGLGEQITSPQALRFYEAQLSTAKVVCFVTGGCLLATTVVVLAFYIRHYIDVHKRELGILKALGCSDLKISAGFAVFALSVLLGAAAGLGGAYLLMPGFYTLQNKAGYLPSFQIGFHAGLPICFVLLPTAAFALLAVGYACLKLRQPAITLLRGKAQTGGSRKNRERDGSPERGFSKSLKRATLESGKTLAFFITFASFCFSAMTQMAFSMRELSSEMMGAMVLVIGLVLATVTLLLAVTTVVRGNSRTIALMRAFGYTEKACGQAVLGGYRPLAYLGFALGTGYQYALLRLVVDIIFRDIPQVPVYRFDLPRMLLSLAVFTLLYELVMAGYARKLRDIPVREIMQE